MLNEADTRAQLIDLTLEKAGWNNQRVKRELRLTEGRIISDKGARKKGKRADYVLYVPTAGGITIAVVEAKEESESALKGIQQAKEYASLLGAMFAFSTNGHEIEEFDFVTNKQTTISAYPSPDELLARYQSSRLPGKPMDLFKVPYYYSDKIPRYYQEVAIKNILESYLLGKKRILITMATGTGKTLVAFQTAWKLFKSGSARRILFITDRIFLRGQAYNTFEPFGDARADIEKVEFTKTRDIYFYTYQTLYSEATGGKRFYALYPRDFFDLIIIDECHRSGFGTWHDILKYFESAVHLGMTATPKRDDNIDTYSYFGNPVYTYSLGQGIEDGFLAPYKIHKVYTNIDAEGGISLSHAAAQGASIMIPEEVKAKDFYTAGEMEQKITIPARTKKICQHLSELMQVYGPKDKTMVFCVNDEHAGEVAKELQNNFSYLGYDNFAQRIVSEEHDAKGMLEKFVDSEKVVPVVATTVDLLSTGIDVPSVKNIVLMKPITSRVLFKQIIGRGSRVDPDVSKFEFRIIDYVNASRLFDSWDYPMEVGSAAHGPKIYYLNGKVVDKDEGRPIGNATVTILLAPNEQTALQTDGNGAFSISQLPKNIEVKATASGYVGRTRSMEAFETPDESLLIELRKFVEKPDRILVDGISVYISQETTLELHDGRTLSKAEYVEYTKGELKHFVLSLEDLRGIWVNPQKRERFLNELREKSISPEVLSEMLGRPDADSFDVLAHVTFGAPILTRDERASAFLNLRNEFMNSLGPNARGIMLSLLNKYRLGGIDNVSPDAFELPPFDKEGYILGVARKFGGLDKLKVAIDEIQKSLYSREIED